MARHGKGQIMPDEFKPDDREHDDDVTDEEEESLDEPERDDDDDDTDDEDADSEARTASEDDEPERPRRRRASSSKKRTEQKKAAQSSSPRNKKGARRRTERSGAPARRSRRTEATEEKSRPSRRRGGAVPRNRKRRKEPREADTSWDLVEPKQPPEPEVDLSGEIEPVWERGIMVGGCFCLTAVACGVVALLMSGGAMSVLSVVGLMVVLVAIVLGGIGVFARKAWGYVVGLGATAVGTVAGLLWTLYCVVTPQLSPWAPFCFLVFNGTAVVSLFHMRWGPGPFADDRARFRALERRLRSYTTIHGELALSGSLAAVLATIVLGFMLMGSASSSGEPASNIAAQMQDGMELETLTSPPELNSLVLARWGNEEYFFLGRVEQQRTGEEFRISYLDGDQAWVKLRDLRRDAVNTGATVHVHIQGHEGWLPAIITQRSNNRVEADVGAAQRVWVPLSMVRIREGS
jgi:hypothetical protein